MTLRSIVRRFAVALYGLVALLNLSGCGKSTPQGTVSGRVTFEGRPVAEGRVSFENTDAGTGGDGELMNGSYRLTAPLPPGEYKVMVMPLVVQQQEGGKGPEVGVEKKAPDIPQRYRVIGTTDLKSTVKDGPNVLDFDLKR